MWEAIASQPAPTEERKVQVGDVVHCEGSSAILGDVIAVDEIVYGQRFLEVRWRQTFSVEDEDDLILADDQSKPKPTLPLFDSGQPELAQEASETFGSAA